ncbi:transporter substrate-binding protein, partial [Salmonella enterica]|uniref:transporter substrate-binding protein n=1 Tax=Salmonella enterica TaxID=28901 RepID=UPI001C8B3EB7
MFFFFFNYVYPYESNRTISDLFLQVGGQVLDEMYVPLNLKTEDVAKIIRHIHAAKPDVIYSTIVGDGIIPSYTAFKEAGFDAATMPISSQSTSEADVIRMRPEVAAGHITAAPFFASLDTPRARAFVSAYERRYGLQMPP